MFLYHWPIPPLINSSATQSQWAAIFPQKATTTVCLAFCINSSSMLGRFGSKKVPHKLPTGNKMMTPIMYNTCVLLVLDPVVGAASDNHLLCYHVHFTRPLLDDLHSSLSC